MPATMRIVVAETIAEEGIELLREHGEVDVAAGLDRSELLERLAGAHALVVRSATAVDAEVFAAAPDLKVVGRAGIGVDNIDLDAATRAGVVVVNAPQANAVSAAEHTLALLLSQARRIPEADRALRDGRWERERFEGVELYGKTLGIPSTCLAPGRPRACSGPRRSPPPSPASGSSTPPAAAWWTKRRSPRRSPAARSPAPPSTCSPSSRLRTARCSTSPRSS
jgi:hypothetical protein